MPTGHRSVTGQGIIIHIQDNSRGHEMALPTTFVECLFHTERERERERESPARYNTNKNADSLYLSLSLSSFSPIDFSLNTENKTKLNCLFVA